MATITPKALVTGVLLDDSAPETPGLYICPTGARATIRSYTLCNNDNVGRTVSVYIVKVGEVVGNEFAILSELSLAAGETVIDDALRVLEEGDFITAVASVAGVISFRADGSEIS